MTTPSISQSNSLSNEGQLVFLNRVAHDDRFRAELEADPHTVLAQYGLDLDPSQIPATVTLPSEDKLAPHLNYATGHSTLDRILKNWFCYIGS